ncbi:MAG: hypothetical protein H6687_02005 [Bacillales bacterium]|nr:hypothetical protein [Bacillales bacterium]
MKIDILDSSGFCGGVTRALYLLDKTIKEHPGEIIYLIGPIVHNGLVNAKYKEKGVKFISLSDLKSLIDGSIVVISAHGVSNTIKKELERFNVIDTTCPYVIKNKNEIDVNDQNNVIFIGKKDHSETKAMTDDNPHIIIVEKVDDLSKFQSNSFGEVFNQTTFNIDELRKIHNEIKERAPFYSINNTMCSTSVANQEFIKDKKDYNVCIIVGDKTSNNANSLFDMSPYQSTYFIQSHDEIANMRFRDFDSVIIIGSASTPKSELKLVKEAIKRTKLIDTTT